MRASHSKLVIFGFLLLFILAIPVTLSLVQTRHEVRSRADNSTPIPAAVCGSAPTDIMLVIDASNSMSATIDTSGHTKIQAAQAAAVKFVDIMAANSSNKVGLVTFATTSTLNSPLTTNYTSVKAAINTIKLSQNTCTQCAIDAANAEIKKDGRTGIKPVMILLTDGLANWVSGWPLNHRLDTTAGQAAATTATQTDYAQTKFTLYTIGLGADVSTSFLQNLATIAGGNYYFSPTTTQLSGIYQTISQLIGKGSISGFVFNDVNNNGVFDTGEAKLPSSNVDLRVVTASGSAIAHATTDTTGNYAFTQLCDGAYYATQQLQAGWSQTVPTNPAYYKVAIASGSASSTNIFGNVQRACGTTCINNTSCAGASGACTFCNITTKKCVVPVTPTLTATPSATITPTTTPTITLTPTPTPASQGASLDLTVFLHTIGNAGDNATSAASLSNKHPLHPNRSAEVFVYNTDNTQVADQMGTISYSSASGSFNGTVVLPNTITTGKYYLKIQSEYHLRRLVTGLQTITTGIVNHIPPVTLVAGDANNDNVLSLLDYNLLIGCFSITQPARSCTPAQKVATDFTDDGNVDGTDFNLFIRELSVQEGQ